MQEIQVLGMETTDTLEGSITTKNLNDMTVRVIGKEIGALDRKKDRGTEEEGTGIIKFHLLQ